MESVQRRLDARAVPHLVALLCFEAGCLTRNTGQEIQDVGVRPPFLCHGRGWSVARQYTGLGGKCHDAQEGSTKLRAVAQGQVRPTYGAGKQAIADERDAVTMDRHVSGRMPRGVHHGERQPTQCETLTFDKALRRHFIAIERKPIGRRLKGTGLEDPDVGLVKVDRNREMGSNRPHCADMVEMGVRQPDRTELRLGLFDCGDQLIAIITRVDDCRVTTVAVHDEVRVFLQRPGLERDDFENRGVHAVAIAARRAVRYFSAAIAAVVASPTAVVTCRVNCTRTSPAANRPGIDVCM